MPNVEINILELMGKNKIRTIKDLSKKSGLSRTLLSNLINENKTKVTMNTIYKLCEALNCGVGDLIKIKEDK